MLAVSHQMSYKSGIKGVEAPSIPNQNEGLVRMARKNVKHLPVNIKVPDGAIAIPLSQGRYALVDAEDFEKVNQYGWSLGHSPNKRVHYAIGRSCKNGVITRLLMHRLIMEAPDDMCIDHINHDGLDNRKANLRLVTRKENVFNSRPVIGRSTKGVWFYRNKWNARIERDGKRYYLGSFNTQEEAQAVYNDMAIKLFEGKGYIVPLLNQGAAKEKANAYRKEQFCKRYCVACGALFKKVKGHSIYCSKECRVRTLQAKHIILRREKNLALKTEKIEEEGLHWFAIRLTRYLKKIEGINTPLRDL